MRLRNIGAGVVLAGTALGSLAHAQAVDPDLAQSWAFMQEQMPGVSYELLQAACGEGEVMVYHGSWPDAEEKQIEGFSQRFPCIAVRKQGGGMSDIRERYLSEWRAGQAIADIIQDSNAAILDRHAEEGALAEYNISNEGAFRPDEMSSGWWYPLRRGLAGIAWNTDLVSDEDAAMLQEWEGILDPRWKDVAANSDISAGGVAFMPFYAWHELYGEEFFEKLGAQNLRNIAGTSATIAALAAGDVQMVVNASETALVPLYEKGAPLKWSLPTPATGPLTGQAITVNAPHPNAAKLFQEYSFTEEGYGLWQSLGGAPTRIGAEDRRSVASEDWYMIPDEVFQYNDAEMVEAIPVVVDLYNKYVGQARR